MSDSPLGFVCVKGVALAVADMGRARRFYGGTLGLPPASIEGEEGVYLLGGTMLILKDDWYGKPTAEPNPRITIEVENADAFEKALQARGVKISDPVQLYGTHPVGAFLDSEGNKIWFCSEG